MEPLAERIATIVEAKQRGRTLRFVYEGLDGVVSRRLVDPARLSGLSLLAWCCNREEYRRFDLRRMHMVEIGPGPDEVYLPLGEPEEI